MSHPDEMEVERPSFEFLVEYARKGNWQDVDNNIRRFLSSWHVAWAFDVLLNGESQDGRSKHFDQNLRDLAATILHESDVPFHDVPIELLELMERDPHKPVRYRLSMALWKRGYCSPSVRRVLDQARLDGDMGDLARLTLRAVPA